MKTITLIVLVVGLIILMFLFGGYRFGSSRYESMGGTLTEVDDEDFSIMLSASQLVDCNECLKNCDRTISPEKCSLRCYASCSVKEGKTCEETCVAAGGKMDDCDKHCDNLSKLGCEWDCLSRGRGEVCQKDCEDISM